MRRNKLRSIGSHAPQTVLTVFTMDTSIVGESLDSFKVVTRLIDVRKRTPFQHQREINEDHQLALQQDFLLNDPDIDRYPIFVTLADPADLEKAQDVDNYEWIHVTQVFVEIKECYCQLFWEICSMVNAEWKPPRSRLGGCLDHKIRKELHR